jgi:hypothetical protein
MRSEKYVFQVSKVTKAKLRSKSLDITVRIKKGNDTVVKEIT